MRRMLLVVLASFACTGAPERRLSTGVLETTIRTLGPAEDTGETAILHDSTLVVAPGSAGVGGMAFDWAVDAAPDEYQSAVRGVLTETRPARPIDRALRLPPTLRWSTGADTTPQLTRWRLSNVGFSPDSTHAAIYVEYYCGALCGGGSFYLYRRDAEGEWERTDILPVFNA